MLTAPIALAAFVLANQQPAAPPADGAVTPAQHDPEAANRAAIRMLTTGEVKFELVDSNDVEHKATLVRIDGTNVVLRSGGADYSIPVDQLRRIERPADRRWDGALIGFAVGAGIAPFVSAAAAGASILGGAPNHPRVTSNGPWVSVLCISTALGYAIDATHGRKHTVFVGTMPATPAAHGSALAVGVPGHAHDRGLQAIYRLTF